MQPADRNPVVQTARAIAEANFHATFNGARMLHAETDEDDAAALRAVDGVAAEGFALFAYDRGEVCTCPSRARIQAEIYEAFIARAIDLVQAIHQGAPRLIDTLVGAQASQPQQDKIMSDLKIGVEKGAQVLAAGYAARFNGDLANGFYIQASILKGLNKMRVFQDEIFGSVVSVTTFKDEEEAPAIANDTIYGPGAGIWSRDANRRDRFGRGVEVGPVWVNSDHVYRARAAFGGNKQSGIGRENHKMMPDHPRQTKTILMSDNPNKLGVF